MTYTQEERQKGLLLVKSTILNCEKNQDKFEEGSAQYSLLKNRIHALYIAKALLEDDGSISSYTKEECLKAEAPIKSIIAKSQSGQKNQKEGTATYNRFKSLIDSMTMVEALLKAHVD